MGYYAGTRPEVTAWAKGAHCSRHTLCRVHTVKRTCGHAMPMCVTDTTAVKGGFFKRMRLWTATRCDECESGLPIVDNFPVFSPAFIAAHPIAG